MDEGFTAERKEGTYEIDRQMIMKQTKARERGEFARDSQLSHRRRPMKKD